jgi:2-isopropylmalate synthase
MIYFAIYLFLEVTISLQIASYIGGLATFFEIIASAMLGFAILANFGSTFMQNLKAVSLQKIDLKEFQRLNLFTIVGAIFLIFPGFLTDIIGLLMEIFALMTLFIKKMPHENRKFTTQDNFRKKDDDVIDVEVINDTLIHK